jgi:hypothetical protein
MIKGSDLTGLVSPVAMKYSPLKIAVLPLISLLVIAFIGLLLTFFGLKNIVQGSAQSGIFLLRLSKPISWTVASLTFHSVQAIEVWHAANNLLTSQGKFLVLLQNSDEIRATGGFIGSYTILDLASSEPLRLVIRDMYDPSGLSQTLPSPPGQAKYLSEGQGLKLVDANWNPDFPTSAELILQYFALLPGDPKHYDGVIGLPLTTVERVVTALGGVYVADQQQTITGETLADLVRRDRDQFFAGSQEKTQALQAVYTAIKLKLADLSLADWLGLIKALNSNRLLQEVQFFALNPSLQNNYQTASLDGALLPYGDNELYLFPVESNVGINKANRKVERFLSASLKGQRLTLTTVFKNNYTKAARPELDSNSAYAVAPHLSYVNYYRLLTRPDMMVISIKINDELVETWDETELISAAGLLYKQVGFLVVVPEQERVTVEAQFETPLISQSELIIQRQVGLPYTSISDSIE